MAGPLYFDRVMETSTTTGNTSPFTLAGAVTGFQSWSVVGNTNTAPYCAEAVDANGVPTGDWEVGLGTYTSSGTTLARTQILASSNSGSAVNFGAGTKRVFLTRPAVWWGYVNIQDQKSAGSNGGTFTSGSWQIRTLNTEVSDLDNLATLSSNQITLVAGTYLCNAIVPAGHVSQHKARLQNVTGSATILVGTQPYTLNSEYVDTPSMISGVFTIAASQALEIQHQCASTEATYGFGSASNFAEVEVYTVVEFWRIG